MTAHETPDELRARLGVYVGAFQDTPSTEERVAWARQIVNAWPAIDALLARLTAAEADADRGWAWVDVLDDDIDAAEIYGTIDIDRDTHRRLVALRDPS